MDDYGSTKTVQQKIDEAYDTQRDIDNEGQRAIPRPVPAIGPKYGPDQESLGRRLDTYQSVLKSEAEDQAATVKALQTHLARSEFLERDRARMAAIQMQREERAANPERHRRVAAGVSALPLEPFRSSNLSEMPKKEAKTGDESCWASIDSLTRVNEGPRMGQISARSLLIAAAGLIPTQPTETQWSAIKEAIYSLPSTTFEE